MFWDHDVERAAMATGPAGVCKTVYRYAYAGGLSTVAARNRALHPQQGRLLANPALGIVPGEVEMEVIAMIGVVGRAQYRREDAARAVVHCP